MKTLSNHIVSVDCFEANGIIRYQDTAVGEIHVEDGFISISVDPQYQGLHYATNGLYLFTDYIHNDMNIYDIRAIISKDNDIAKHVFEHSGYHIEKKEENYTVYLHNHYITSKDDNLELKDNEGCVYLAGGCFWGMERVFKILDGIISTCTGYVNGHTDNPSYEDIIRNDTGYKECVRVIFDKNITDIKTILKAYFMCIDPAQKDGQKEDIGEQYMTGIYYRDDDMLDDIKNVYETEKARYSEFYVELKKLEVFYEAEEYHQNYLDKNPEGYCHITRVDLEKVKELNSKRDVH